MERGHHIESEEITVKSIVVSSIHRLDLKTLGEKKAAEFIITIGHFVRGIPPKAAGIKNIGSGQDQSSSFIEEISKSFLKAGSLPPGPNVR